MKRTAKKSTAENKIEQNINISAPTQNSHEHDRTGGNPL
jgi:hypothetical protein